MDISIEITIPVLNEEESLKSQVKKILVYLAENKIKHGTIVIADNGSTDRTPEIGRDIALTYENVKYLRVDKKGVGLALRTSWEQSQADIVGYMDLDLATDINHLQEVCDLFEKHNALIVNGSRWLEKSIVVNRSVLRGVTSYCFNFLVRTCFSNGISDGMCGFKFFKREVAQELINTGIDTDGWIFSTEILIKALWLNLTITEIAVKWTDDPNSKVKIVRLSYDYLKHLLSLRMAKSEWMKRNAGRSFV